MTLPMPRFYKYFNKTYKLDRKENGNVAGFMLNLRTGAFDENNQHIDDVLFAMGEAEIRKLNEQRFIQETEMERQHYLRGDGPIFALYDTIEGLYEQARAEDRRLSQEELALIVSLRSRTFQMWEAEFARQATGEPPSFEVRSVLSPER